MNKEEINQNNYFVEEDFESPYCEICGTCGCVDCCGIINFIEHHIEGKTNCKNEGWIISDLIGLCEYKDDVFEENKQLKEKYLNAVSDYENEKSKNQKAIEYIKENVNQYTNPKKYDELLEILKGDSND